LSLEQIRALLEASQEVRFTGHSREDIYCWVRKTLREHKMTRQSRAQAPRLIGKYLAPPVRFTQPSIEGVVSRRATTALTRLKPKA
jgi:hypothetical protein